MLNIKKTEILLGILLLLFISGFYIIQHPSIVTDLFLIDSRAISQNVALSASVTGSAEEELTIPTLGEIKPTDSMISQTIPKITGLTDHENGKIKIRVYTNASTPPGFTAPPPTSVETVFNYVNITLDTTLTNIAIIYFNVSSSDLNSIDPDDIRLFKHSSTWTELTTTVEDSSNDPVSFSATTTSFSRFLIGEKGEGEAVPAKVVTPSVEAGRGSYGGPGTESIVVQPPLRPPIKPIIIPKIIKEKVEKIAEVIVEKPTGVEIWLYAILPLLILGLTSVSLLYYLVKTLKSYKKVTLSVILLGLGIIVLVTPFTNEVLYWAILPLSIIIIFIFMIFMLISHYRHIILKHLANTLKLKLGTKTYLILLLFVFIICLLLIARSGFVGYAVSSIPLKSSFGFVIFSILIILGIGLYYFKMLKK